QSADDRDVAQTVVEASRPRNRFHARRALQPARRESDVGAFVGDVRSKNHFSIIAVDPFHSSDGGSSMYSLHRSASLREAASRLPSVSKTSRKRIPASVKLRAR